jgi:hypothetical protein
VPVRMVSTSKPSFVCGPWWFQIPSQRYGRTRRIPPARHGCLAAADTSADADCTYVSAMGIYYHDSDALSRAFVVDWRVIDRPLPGSLR